MKYVVSHAVKYIDTPPYTSILWIPAVENLPIFSVVDIGTHPGGSELTPPAQAGPCVHCACSKGPLYFAVAKLKTKQKQYSS